MFPLRSSSNNPNLTERERRILLAYLQEAQSRGLPVADSVREYISRNTRAWVTGENGYFSYKDGRQFRPYEEQENFIKSEARFALFLGGRGSGKSASGAQKALRKIQQGFSGAVFNPSFENFKTSTWVEFRNWIPWEYVNVRDRYRADPSWEPQRPFTLSFENGASVQCKGLKDAASARGQNSNWLWYDEAQDDMDGMGWKIAIASVRVGKNPQAWATATGRGTYHWMYNFFVEQAFPEEVLELMEEINKEIGNDKPLIEWFHGTISDNKENLDPMFYASMLSAYPVGYLREQEINGAFSDPGGNLGDPAWFNGKILPKQPNPVKSRVWYWDLAASEQKVSGPSGKKLTDPDETVGTLLSWWEEDGDDRFCIEKQVSGTWVWADIKVQIRNAVETTGMFVPVYVEQEPASGGKNQLAALFEYLEEELPGFTFRSHNPKEQGDKIMRANIWFAEAALGKFYMLEGNWNEQFKKQLAVFPTPRQHDDKIDSVSGARIIIAPIRRWKKIKFMHLGQPKEESSDNV